MADLSNKALSLLLLIAIAVSVTGTIMTFNSLRDQGATGRAVTPTQTGSANFTINTAMSIKFNQAAIPFGSGYVNTSGGNQFCYMGTNNSNPTSAVPADGGRGCVGFNTSVASANLTIENDGNVLANVSLNFTNNATTFMGTGGGSYMYAVKNNESSSCGAIGNGSSFVEVGTAATDLNPTMSRICTNLNFSDTSDTIDVAVWLKVPYNATTGLHTSTITAMGCDTAGC